MIDRVSGREAFRRFRADGVRGRSGSLTVVVVSLDDVERPSVAFALSRSVGSAVVRNRLRRQLRVAANELFERGELPPSAYLVIVHPSAVGSTMTTLRDDLGRAVQRATSAPRSGRLVG